MGKKLTKQQETLLNEHQIIAVRLMRDILYCNGIVNRYNPERIDIGWIEKLEPLVSVFFDNNPQFLNDEDIMSICDGDFDENEERFGNTQGYKELSAALTEFFDAPHSKLKQTIQLNK
jgi:hypothetical protein